MATITLTIDNARIARVVDAICANNGYQETVPNPDPTWDGVLKPQYIPNPQTKAQFTNAWLRKTLKEQTRQHEGNRAAESARVAAMAAVDVEITIT
jgi:hypothetical protein